MAFKAVTGRGAGSSPQVPPGEWPPYDDFVAPPASSAAPAGTSAPATGGPSTPTVVEHVATIRADGTTSSSPSAAPVTTSTSAAAPDEPPPPSPAATAGLDEEEVEALEPEPEAVITEGQVRDARASQPTIAGAPDEVPPAPEPTFGTAPDPDAAAHAPVPVATPVETEPEEPLPIPHRSPPQPRTAASPAEDEPGSERS